MANEGRVIRIISSDIAGTAALAVNLTDANVASKLEAGETTFASLNGEDPRGICCDWSGNLYIADTAAHAIYKLDEGGRFSLYAGLPGTSGGNGTLTKVAALSARFNAPRGICCDRSGNVYVADTGNHQIRVIKDGYVSHLAGQGDYSFGAVDGAGADASFREPYDVAVDPRGDVYVADRLNNCIRKIANGGTVSTFAGSQVSGDKTNVATTAKEIFNAPEAVTIDANGNLFVCDTGNYKIKKITPRGWVYWHSGSTQGKSLGTDRTDGLGKNNQTVQYNDLSRGDVDRSGNLYVVDVNIGSGSRLVRVNTEGVASVVNDFRLATGDLVNNNVVSVCFSPAGKMFVVVFN
jgi:sugar lactone lactonase YvrE